ncbi:hypothetical protein BVY02_01150 [bacterium J17]|nr:hypothetical protein BVY02_01150 [bacterium J17]
MSESSINIPEQSVELGSGFLRDYWESKEPLPKFEGLALYWYFVQRAFQTVISLPMSSFITIMTIAVSLFLLSGFLLLLTNVDRMISSAGGTLQVTAYFAEGATEGEITSLIEKLEQSPKIRSIEFVSKSKALENFRADLGSRSSFLEGLDENNPLPSSIDIVFRPDELGINSLEKTIAGIRNTAFVDEVVYGSEWVEKTQGVLRLFRYVGVVTLGIALLIIVFLIANTIKLVIYSRRDEIAIMQLVGASDSFVKVPFILGGLFQGILGSVVAIFFLRVAFSVLNIQVKSSNVFGVAIPRLMFLDFWSILGVIFLGVVVGAIGSMFALGRFMNV